MISTPGRFFLAALSAVVALYPGVAAEAPPSGPAALQVLSVEGSLRIAMENNRRRPACRLAVAIAEAQHRQVLAGYWPQVSAKAGWFRLDEVSNFVFPAKLKPGSTMKIRNFRMLS